MLRGTRFNPLKTVRDGKDVLVEQPPAGTYVYRYSISSGKGNWAATRAWQQGMGFNMPLIGVVSEDELSPKTLPAEQSFLSVPGDTLAVTALKKADQGDGIVVRFFEAAGESAETNVHFLGQPRGVRPVNMLEEPTSSGNEQTLHVQPFEIDTIEIPAPSKAAK